ncbi:hypothetical protein [Sphingobium aromaticiconvertens]|uniref:hypothetical protein n=1 Tax=Sphingobium aromaticiconvertens TaxID=365341 RepID=UPI00301A98F5
MIARLLDPLRPYLAGAAGLAIAASLAWGLRVDHLRATYKRDLSTSRAEYAAFRTVIVNRTAEALRLDRARNTRVASEQVAIIRKEQNAYLDTREHELTRLAERLRTAPRADPGGSGDAGGSALPILSDGPVRPGQAAIVDVADAEACTDNTLKLESLITAWRGVAAIDPNEPTKD